MAPSIEVNNLTYRYDLRTETKALLSVSFTVHQGEWLAIIGNNGSGKSTLAQLLTGLLEPQQGSIFIADMEMTEKSKWEIRNRIGVVFQNPENQFIGSTVQDDVAFGLENLNMDYKEMKKRVNEALKMVGLFEYRLYDPSHLSGGQKQRVAIAGALAMKPDVLILDEAFVMLDPRSRRELLETIHELKVSADLTVVSITHDMTEVEAADRVVVLDNGQVTNIGKPSEIFTQEKELTPPLGEKLRRALAKRGANVPQSYMSREEMMCWLWK